MAQISLYIEDAIAQQLGSAAGARGCSVSKYVSDIVKERLAAEDAEESRKKAALKGLRGALDASDFEEPSEIPWESEIPRARA